MSKAASPGWGPLTQTLSRMQLDGLGAATQRTVPGEDAADPRVRASLDGALADVLRAHSGARREVCVYGQLVPAHFDQFPPLKRFVV